MQITVRGVLLLGAIVLTTLKLAGVLTWPWLAVLLPALIYALPFIWALACAAAAVALTAVLMLGILLMGAAGAAVDAARRHQARKRREAALSAGAAVGPWDGAA